MRIFRKKLGIALLALCITAGLGTMSAQAAQEKAPAKVKSVSIKTNTGGDFVKGVSKANVTFQISGSKSDVVVSILSESGATVYKKTFSNCSTNKKYTLAWSGKRSNGKYIAGTYRAKVTAGKSSKKTGGIKLITKSDFAGGDGSKSHPYKVASAEQFRNIAKHNGMNFAQTRNISFSGKTFSPLFTSDEGFSGVYDGKNYTINGIEYSSTANYTGLFRKIEEKGTVKGIKLKSCTISGNDYTGGITAFNCGKILNCSAEECIITGTGNNVGAITGGVGTTGSVKQCKVRANILQGNERVGGITGYSYGKIESCTTEADMINCQFYGGGITGILYSGAVVSDCTFTESNITVRTYAGGIVGHSAGIVKGCTVYNEKSEIKATGSDWGTKFYNAGLIGFMATGGLQTGNTYYGELKLVGNG